MVAGFVCIWPIYWKFQLCIYFVFSFCFIVWNRRYRIMPMIQMPGPCFTIRYQAEKQQKHPNILQQWSVRIIMKCTFNVDYFACFNVNRDKIKFDSVRHLKNEDNCNVSTDLTSAEGHSCDNDFIFCYHLSFFHWFFFVRSAIHKWLFSWNE